MSPPNWTPAQIEDAIHRALKAHDIPAVGGLLALMAVADPHRAEVLMETMKLGVAIAERR